MSHGLAIDCGTTFISLAVKRLTETFPLATGTVKNPCLRFGEDVLTRADAAEKNPAAKKALADDVWETICECAYLLCQEAGLSLSHITHISFCANPVLSLLSFSESAASLTHHPFALPQMDTAPDFDLKRHGFCSVVSLYRAPCVSSFVGGDALLGFCANETESPHLYADLGTNGELFLQTKDRLYAASTAAGPAFEGRAVRCGMRAGAGAVTRVKMTDGRFVLETQDNTPARGLTATAVVDLLCAAHDAGLIRDNGYIDGGVLSISDTLTLSTDEVRAVLLAKSALCAGIETLLLRAGLTPDDVVSFTLSGALSAHLDLEKAARLGLFPAPLLSKIRLTENAALTGALRALDDAAFCCNANKVISRTLPLNLAEDADFQSAFINGMHL